MLIRSRLLLLVLVLSTMVSAQQRTVQKSPPVKPAETAESSTGKVTLSIFGDMNYVVNEPKLLDPSKGTSGRNDFLLNRAAFGYDHSFSRDAAARIQYDGASNTILQAYAEVRNIQSFLDIKIGRMQTLSTETMEKVWDYRALAPSVLERSGLTHEFDMGLALTGRLNTSGALYMKAAVYNGNGTAPENNKLKKTAIAIGDWLDRSSVVEVYADFENLSGNQNAINAKLSYGMNTTKFSLGAEAYYRLHRFTVTDSSISPVGASLMGAIEVSRGWKLVVRGDYNDQNISEGVNGYRIIYVTGGVDYSPVPEVRLLPNIVYEKHMEKENTPYITDVITARLTMSVSLK